MAGTDNEDARKTLVRGIVQTNVCESYDVWNVKITYTRVMPGYEHQWIEHILEKLTQREMVVRTQDPSGF